MKFIFSSISLWVISLCFTQSVTLPSPLNSYYHSGKDFSRHHEVVQFFEALRNLFPTQVKIENYGTTQEGRPLILVFISSAENIQQLNRIQEKHLQNSTDEKIAITWLSYNVHGNESCGTEASMETAYRLLSSNTSLLNENLIIIDPCLNPDGRDRYVNYFKQYHNQTGQYDASSAEHDETWPGGRPNHFLFDLNRDWAWLTQVESKQRIKVYNQWLPHVHVDFHEQGMNEPYYFPPAAEPYHEVITTWQRDFQTHIGKHHASYFDKNGWLYFSKEIFDLLYPSYGDTYPTFNGAIGMTYEQGGSGRAGLGVIINTGDTLTLAERISHHVIAGISTLETVQDHHQKMLNEFQQFQEKNLSNLSKTYILDGSAPNILSLQSLLDQHEITYTVAAENQPNEIKGWDYFTNAETTKRIKKNDLIITSNQKKGTLVSVLFEQKTKLADSLTYDITAWSLPYAYGIPCLMVNKALTNISGSQEKPSKVNLELKEEPYAIAIQWDNLNAVRALKMLLDSGLSVSFTEKDIETGAGHIHRGSLLILKADNPGVSLKTSVPKILNGMYLNCWALQSGWAEKGTDLGSSSIKNIQKPNVGVLFNDATSSLSMGEIWHFLDVQLGINHQLLRMHSINVYDLMHLDVIFIPEGFQSDNNEALKTWISEGGTCIVMGGGASQFMEEDFGMKPDESKPIIPSRELGNYGNMERSSLSEAIIGAIYKCRVDLTHPLSFGYRDSTYFTLRLASQVYPFQGETVQQIKDKNAWITGFAGYKVKYKQQGETTVGIHNIGDGKIIYFFDNPLFRGFWENGKLQVANAIYFLND